MTTHHATLRFKPALTTLYALGCKTVKRPNYNDNGGAAQIAVLACEVAHGSAGLPGKRIDAWH